MLSIRARLQRRLAWLIAAVWAPASVLIIVAVALEYSQSIHNRTAHTAQLMLAFASSQPTPTIATAPMTMPRLEQWRGPDFDLGDYLVVVSRHGRLLYSSEALPPDRLLTLPMHGETNIGDTTRIFHGFEDERSGTRVVIGVNLFDPLFSSLHVAGLVAAYVLVSTVLIAITLGVGIRSGLAPLGAFARQVRARSEDNLEPLDEAEAPDELRGVAHALNALMAGLRVVLARERDFVSSAAHELRTPLTAIRAQVEALGEDLPDRSRPRFANILQATDRAGRLISQLLDVTRSQSVDLTQNPAERMDLVGVVQSVVADLVPLANRRKVEVVLESPRSAWVMTRPELLAIVLRNIVENALKYAGAPGRVVVTITPVADTAAAADPTAFDLLVEDDGPGLTPEAFQRAFARFQRLGRSGDEGVGLGLSIVAELCQRMSVPVERLEPGALGGLLVRLRLPGATPPRPAAVASTVQTVAPSR
jgi:signal transduction histidine kinase